MEHPEEDIRKVLKLFTMAASPEIQQAAVQKCVLKAMRYNPEMGLAITQQFIPSRTHAGPQVLHHRCQLSSPDI
jgi:hypothetical protein